MCRLVALLMLLASAGCPGGDDSDDGGDAGVDGNGDGGDSGPGTGITLTYESRPEIPGQVDNNLTVEAFRIGLENLRVVGDAGTVPVARTELAWSAGIAPEPDVLGDAPAGVYSSLVGMIVQAGNPQSFEIAGRYNNTPYVLFDTEPLALTVPFGSGLSLPAGGQLTLEVRARVEDMIKDIDFDALPQSSGVLMLGPGNGQLAQLRSDIVENITISAD